MKKEKDIDSVIALGSALLALSFLGSSSALASESTPVIYLTCQADPEFREVGPQLVIDRTNRTLRVMPLKEVMPLVERDEMFVGRIEPSSHKVSKDAYLEISVNRYTLRYRMENPLAIAFKMAPVVTGKCAIEDKKF